MRVGPNPTGRASRWEEETRRRRADAPCRGWPDAPTSQGAEDGLRTTRRGGRTPSRVSLPASVGANLWLESDRKVSPLVSRVPLTRFSLFQMWREQAEPAGRSSQAGPPTGWGPGQGWGLPQPVSSAPSDRQTAESNVLSPSPSTSTPS